MFNSLSLSWPGTSAVVLGEISTYNWGISQIQLHIQYDWVWHRPQLPQSFYRLSLKLRGFLSRVYPFLSSWAVSDRCEDREAKQAGAVSVEIGGTGGGIAGSPFFILECLHVRIHVRGRELWVIMTALGSDLWKKKSKGTAVNGPMDGGPEWTEQTACHCPCLGSHSSKGVLGGHQLFQNLGREDKWRHTLCLNFFKLYIETTRRIIKHVLSSYRGRWTV